MNHLLKYPNSLNVFLVLTFLSIFFSSCVEKPGEFVAPVSDTRLEDITLLTSTHYFSETVAKNNDLVVNETDRTVSYLYTQNFDRRGLDSVL
ncbi:MAG: hypothetical protein N3A63_09380, partial [Bacteroidetes bacterium]|nr:hypothetical protein [Bacteroidota bacterium]